MNSLAGILTWAPGVLLVEDFPFNITEECWQEEEIDNWMLLKLYSRQDKAIISDCYHLHRTVAGNLNGVQRIMDIFVGGCDIN